MSAAKGLRGDIQGLRCLAVCSVVAYHANESVVPGGYTGVDIFFVISGYLISGILVREIALGRFSIGQFYARRVRRLFPALYVMLATVLVAGWLILPPAQLKELSEVALSTVVFASKLMLLTVSDYFNGASEMKPLLHTWSLGVEEQFYLVFPPILWLLARGRAWVLRAFVWGGLLASLFACVLILPSAPTKAFYLPVTRAYELLIGVALAIGAAPRVRSAVVLDALAVLGLALIALGFAVFDRLTPFPGLAALAPCAGSALVIYAGEGRRSLADRLIGGAPFRFMGGLSYSLYLWHWPALSFLRWETLGAPGDAQIWAAVLAALLVAWASRAWVEEPFLRPDRRAAPALKAGAWSMAGAAAVCGALILANGAPGRWSARQLRLIAASRDFNPRRSVCHSDQNRVLPYDRACVFGGSGPPSVAVWGDSFGAELVVALGERLHASGGSAMQLTSSFCPPGIGYDPPARPRCSAYDGQTLRRLEADARIARVVMVANYAAYPERDRTRMLAGFASGATTLRSAHKAVDIVFPIPTLPMSAPEALALTDRRGGKVSAFGVAETADRARNGATIRFLHDLSRRIGAREIVPASMLCAKGVCKSYQPGVGVLYFDDVHLSLTGARWLVDALPPEGAGLR